MGVKREQPFPVESWTGREGVAEDFRQKQTPVQAIGDEKV
jgi:hypothetical protein